MKRSPSPDSSKRLAFIEKFSYGIGTCGDQLTTNAVNTTVKPVFNIVLGLSPSLVGLALMLGKIVDAFTDPVMGNISDNTRTRWGRRRPYILFGSITCAIAFPLLWFVPQGWGNTETFIYLIIATGFIALLSTVYSVPWTALGFELTPDYHERTQVMVYRALLTKGIWFIIPWLWYWSQNPIFSNPLVGMRWIGLGLGVIIIGTSLMCFLGCRERYYKAASRQIKVKLVEGIRLTFRNKPFFILMGITVIQVLAIATTISGLGLYVSTYWVYGGDLEAGAKMTATVGTLNSIIGLACIPLISLASKRFGKRATMVGVLALSCLGCIMNWFCYTPAFPLLQLVPVFFFAPSNTAFWLINGSMRADVVDHDEISTNYRREGAYGAIGRWIEKLAFAASFFISGAVLDLAGFDAKLEGAQPEDALLNIRLAYSFLPAAIMALGIYLAKIYPLTEQTMNEYREELEKRRGAV